MIQARDTRTDMCDGRMRVFVTGNQVCMKRGLDSANIRHYFQANGCRIVESPAHADTIIAVTCAFVGSYVDTAVSMIRTLQDYPGKLIVVGCLPAMAPERFRAAHSGPNLITRDLNCIDRLFPEFQVPYTDIRDAIQPDMKVMMPFDPNGPCPISVRNRMREGREAPYMLRVSRGCNNACSYCSHPAALGRLSSKPLEECISDYRRAIRDGARQICIHANDPGAYGTDLGSSYPQLLHALRTSTDVGDMRWMLWDIHPRWLVKYGPELKDIVSWKTVAAISVPLQSGSPRILRAMRRTTSIPRVVEVLRELRASAASLSIATHLIAGFPGETMSDIDATVDVCRRAQIRSAYIFRFSANPNTAAANMEGLLAADTIEKRQALLAKRLTELGIAVDLFA